LGGEDLKEKPRRSPGQELRVAELPDGYVVTLPIVVKELKLSDEQKKKLQTWADEAQDLSRRMGYWRDKDRQDKAKKQLNEQLDSILDKGQRTRLRQLERQLTSRQSGILHSLKEPEFARELNPPADEKAKLEQLAHRRQRLYRALSPYMMGVGPTSGKEADFFEVVADLFVADDARMDKVLGAETKKRLKEMLGEPLETLTNSMWYDMMLQQMVGFQIGEYGPPY